jgi:hypothetical protein
VDIDTFRRDGALHLPGLLAESQLTGLGELTTNGPGARLHDAGLREFIAPATAAARRLIGEAALPVRAVFFDKTAEANWAVAWHQDRTIVVRKRCEAAGFGPWSRKDGLLHVTPPTAVLAGMATLRLHLDPCGQSNAPLKVALGSHRLGHVPAREAAARAGEHPLLVCVAAAGDVWAYSTLILHASERATAPRHRRVLQLDYASTDLPGGLEWAGLASYSAA